MFSLRFWFLRGVFVLFVFYGFFWGLMFTVSGLGIWISEFGVSRFWVSGFGGQGFPVSRFRGSVVLGERCRGVLYLFTCPVDFFASGLRHRY